jgi:hypothetical protein
MDIIIGTLPGYNTYIDTISGDLQKDLLENITFIDLYLASYSIPFIERLFEAATTSGGQITEVFKNLYNAMQTNINNALTDPLYEYYSADSNPVASEMVEKFNKAILNCGYNGSSIRFISANDTTFTQSLSNSYGENNFISDIVDSIGKGIGNFLNNKVKGIGNVAGAVFSSLGKLHHISYDEAFKMLSTFSTSNPFLNLFKKNLLGVQIGLPLTFDSSRYSTTLNIFVKLTSPTGNKSDIQKYIINPLKLILSLGAPNSFDGITYSLPFIYKIISYGNTEFKIGAFESIVITQGSVDTTLNDDLLPLSLDVRITFRSLASGFANVVDSTSSVGLGLESPSNINPPTNSMDIKITL